MLLDSNKDDQHVNTKYRLRYPAPKRLFLDTNVIWQIQTIGRRWSYISPEEIIAKVGKRGLEDWESMNWIIDIAELYHQIQFVTSEQTLHELRKYESRNFGRDRIGAASMMLESWNRFKKENVWNEDFENSAHRARTWLSYGVFDFLPDDGDRKQIAAAMSSHCSDFITVDYRTILPYRKRIRELTNMRVLTPSQYHRRQP